MQSSAVSQAPFLVHAHFCYLVLFCVLYYSAKCDDELLTSSVSRNQATDVDYFNPIVLQVVFVFRGSDAGDSQQVLRDLVTH